MKPTNRAHIVLKRAFERLQKQNPKFSIRALATKLGISHVFMLKLLKGEASIPDKKLPALIKVLGLDDLSKAELRDALVYDAIREKLEAFPGLKSKTKLATEQFEEYPSKHYSVLDHWYDLAILDLLTCTSADVTPKGIAKRLGLTSQEVEHSLEKMSKLGLATCHEGEWKKSSRKIRFPTTLPGQTTRNYYRQVLDKAKMELEQATPERFAKRSITNLCIAVNSSQVEQAKQKLQQLTYELAGELAEGPTDDVYFLTYCLFPVTKEER